MHHHTHRSDLQAVQVETKDAEMVLRNTWDTKYIGYAKWWLCMPLLRAPRHSSCVVNAQKRVRSPPTPPRYLDSSFRNSCLVVRLRSEIEPVHCIPHTKTLEVVGVEAGKVHLSCFLCPPLAMMCVSEANRKNRLAKPR